MCFALKSSVMINWIATFMLIACLDVTLFGSALKCWKCISHDCDSDPEDNYKASKVKCKEDERCMKVRYRMFDNSTHYDSVIRTCTNNACEMYSAEEFYSCLATPTKYMISGCTLRSCCNDKDLCNSSDSLMRAFAAGTLVLSFCLQFIFSPL